MPEYSFSYHSVSKSEDQFLDDLEKIISDCKIDKETSDKLKLALSEAFTNALVHGNKLDPDKKIAFNIVVNKTDVVADITDEGKGGLKGIADRPSPEPLSEGGRGIDLIKYYVSDAQFQENESGHLTVSIRMERKLSIEV